MRFASLRRPAIIGASRECAVKVGTGVESMSIARQYRSDVARIVERRHDNGGDFWAAADGRVGVGSPFSTVQCVLMLSDLGMEPSNPIIRGASELILRGWHEDGRFGNLEKGSIYPCHTAAAARVLGRTSYGKDDRLQLTYRQLLDTAHKDGGWRCAKFSFGRGPETESSNPGPTLDVLDAFRFTDYLNQNERLDKAVEFLLDHWVTRKPLGPCHFGIGTLFMQVEYPLFRYNLFNYVYVLSFYERAKEDRRFHQALDSLESRLTGGEVVVERPHRRLASMSFCRRGVPSTAATVHYREIQRNLGRRPS